MMDHEIFHVPIMFRDICYLAGLSVYLATAVWLGRAVLGKTIRFTLGQTGFIWAARILACFTVVGMIQMLIFWPHLPKKAAIVPGLALLYLLAAYGLTNIPERP